MSLEPCPSLTLPPSPELTAPPGTLFRASQFLAEELPIRLAHRVQELEELPDGLNEMPSVKKVADWYAQSFEVGTPSKIPLVASSGVTHMRTATGNHYPPPTKAGQ